MQEASISLLGRWSNFYVIVGSSAGALTGLQFVVMTLIAEAQAAGNPRDISAFGTPTVVHFCAALMIAAIMSAPWSTSREVEVCLGIGGVLGLAYGVRVLRHATKSDYKPDAEDWFWYTCLPLLAYLAVVVAALLFEQRPQSSLLLIAATSLVFLFAGIHNSWDTVTYVALKNGYRKE